MGPEPMAESGGGLEGSTGGAQARERAEGTPREGTHPLLSMVPGGEIATAWAGGARAGRGQVARNFIRTGCLSGGASTGYAGSNLNKCTQTHPLGEHHTDHTKSAASGPATTPSSL